MSVITPELRSAAVREAIASMRAYTLEPRVAELKLDQNESPFDVPAETKAAILERAGARPWNLYPDFELVRVRQAWALAFGIAPDEVLFGNGSNELLLAALATFVEPGRRVVFPSPTFTLYEKLAVTLGGTPVPVAFDPATGELPAAAMIEAARGSSDAIFVVCSPNNPTGGVLAEGDLGRLLDAGTVLLDRAYGEFDDAPMPPIDPRLVVFRTFSKAFGLAGLRIGAVVSTVANCREIRKVKLPYNLNFFSEEAAIAMLGQPELIAQRVAAIRAERERLVAGMRTIDGIRPFPTRANFIAFETSRAPRVVFDALLERGILVRDVSAYPRLGSALRVSVGSAAQNDRFIQTLREVMA